MDAEGEHIREVYARFGLAMYQAQVLEHDIINALLFSDLIPSKASNSPAPDDWANEVDAFMGKHFEKTLGRMISALRARIAVSDTLEHVLSEALQRRNWLAHTYFRARADEFMTWEGRQAMLVELEAAHALFESACQKISDAIRPLRHKVGFTDAHIERLLDESLSKLRKSL